MKICCIRVLILLTLFVGSREAALAVTFTTTPTTVSNTYSGVLTLQINGVPTGETVLVQKYLDVNNSGVIDAGDWLVQQFSVTDGQAATIGGITNYNVPGDEGAIDGSITTVLSFQPPALNGDIAQNYCGNYLFRVSSPAGHFAPLTNSFTVTAFGFPQSVSGTVSGNGSPLPFAAVLALQVNGGPVAATLADGTGRYSLALPPGAYQMAGISSNFVINLATTPRLTLTPGANLTTNVNLLAVAQTVTGRVADTNDITIGLPGLLVLATDTNYFLGATLSDSNGNYSVSTRSSLWNLSVNSSGSTLHGYLTTGSKTKVSTGGGSVTGVNLLLPKATAMFYGTVTDDLGNPLPGVELISQDATGQFADSVTTTPDGRFNAGALAGPWMLQLNNANPGYANYVFTSSTNFIFTNNQALRINFSGILGSNHLSGTVTRSTGSPIAGASVVAFASINGMQYQTTSTLTDSNGHYSLLVPDGYWSVSLNATNGGNNSLNAILGANTYQQPSLEYATLYGNDATVNFSIFLCGGISIVTTNTLPDGYDGITYANSLVALSCNNLTWSTTGGLPPGMFLSPVGTFYGAPTNYGTFHFTATATDTAASTASRDFTLTIQPPPKLNFALVGNQLKVTYPVSALSYMLFTTTNLVTGPWTYATGGIPIFGGDTNTISYLFNLTAPAQFFRLATPGLVIMGPGGGPVGFGGGGLP